MLSAREKIQPLLPTPVLNTPYFSSVFGGEDGSQLKTDEKGFLRSLEFIALENSFFEIKK